MADTETESNQPRKAGGGKNQQVIDRLVFAALKEQTRARRWRVFYMLFFIGYLSVVTFVLLTAEDSDTPGAIKKADGEKHTALVKLSGVIASGESGGADNIMAGLKAAFKHADTAGIVLEINSPGGSPVQSAYIFDEIMRLKQEHAGIPVYAVVGDMAASGGYFVAAAADRIYVNKSSLVGSIGVRLDGFGFVETMKKLGIERRLLTAGENKGMFDPFLPEKSREIEHLQAMLDEVHGHFIAAVKQGRGDRLTQDQDIFSGLIWSGEQALKLGLVDDYGTTRSVARELDAEEVVDFTPKADILRRIAEFIGSSAGRSISESLLGNYSLN
ncbi:MAG: S49 family peptidase [Gammaproteobacteria bacterium]|nr:S49 family peptidase [Gammaproteobacteria bacterium]MDH3537469.1 S49 family peptidase [Gammaproteobacteria bacterium]